MLGILKKLVKFWFYLKADKKRLLVAALVVAILVIGIGRIIASRQSKVNYQTAKASKDTLVSSISASGKTMTAGILTINTQASGIVSKVFVKDGDKVYQGQKIAEIKLDSAGLQQSAQSWASYLSAVSSLDGANSSLYTLQSQMFAANQKFINDAVARNLATDDPTYIQEYADWKAAEAKYLNQTNTINQAKAGLSSASISYQQNAPVISVPFAGEIQSLSLVEGMVLSNTSSSTSTSNQKVAVIKSETNPIVAVDVSEVDVVNIKIGQKATITFDSIPDKTFTGTVATVDREGSTSNNVTSYSVKIKLDTNSEQILPNMAVTANIITDTKSSVLSVPSSALQTLQGQTVARVLRGGKEVNVPVETGIVSDSKTEIVSGLSEGDEVITAVTSTTATSTNRTSVFGGATLRGFGGGGGR
jgi:macrolide-specific efflux system membrane fusion protein